MPRNQKLKYDVFLSHNSKEKPLVRKLKRRLKAAGLAVWLDEDDLKPGTSWLDSLETGIRSVASVAVLVGRDGLGPWEDQEMKVALALAVRKSRPIIPVLLPGAPRKPALPAFLGVRSWVDLRRGFSDKGIMKLVWGITGIAPRRDLYPTARHRESRVADAASFAQRPDRWSAVTAGPGTSATKAIHGPASPNVRTTACVIFDDMEAAFLDMRDAKVKSLSVISYIGNITFDMLLRGWKAPNREGVKLRLLVRDPDATWLHPPPGTAQHEKRVRQINDHIADLTDRADFATMAHQDPGSVDSRFCSFFPSEPCVRAVLAESQAGKKSLYLGFYLPQMRPKRKQTTQQNTEQTAQQILDFSGTGGPVLKIAAEGRNEAQLVADFEAWFDFTWHLQTERRQIAIALHESTHRRRVVAVDFDGVIADTDAIKINWLSRHGIRPPAGSCSRSGCVPDFCSETQYARMSIEVYARQSTLDTPEVAGAAEAIRDLSRKCQVFVLTARAAENVRWVEEWLRKHGLDSSIACVLSTGQANGKVRKIDTAARCGAVALIDDDARHLLPRDHTGIKRLLFCPKTAPNVAEPLIAVSSWKQALRIVSGVVTSARQSRPTTG